MLEIKIKNLRGVKLPEQIDNGDWIDLRAAEEMYTYKGESYLISLGIAVQLPEGYEANIVPRSSTFKNFGLIQTNSFGVVDESYCGNDDEWMFPVYAIRSSRVRKNDRICQFRINKKMEEVSFIEVDNLDNKNRGGHGSTGIN